MADDAKNQAMPEPMGDKKPEVATKAPEGTGYYKKNNVMKWVIIYVIIGAIVYGAYYLFYMAPKATGGY